MEGNRVVHQIRQPLVIPVDSPKSSRSHRLPGDGKHLAVYVDGQRALYAQSVGRSDVHKLFNRDDRAKEAYSLRNHRRYRGFVAVRSVENKF